MNKIQHIFLILYLILLPSYVIRSQNTKILNLKTCADELTKIPLTLNTNEFTICLRFSLTYLTPTYVLWSENLTSIHLSNFESKIGFVSVHSQSQIFMYPNEILPEQWVHLCYTYKQKYISIVLNGQLLHDDIFIDTEPENVLENTDLYLGHSNEIPYQSFNGYISDLNIWTDAKNVKEMKYFTSDCKAIPNPDLIDWSVWSSRSK